MLEVRRKMRERSLPCREREGSIADSAGQVSSGLLRGSWQHVRAIPCFPLAFEGTSDPQTPHNGQLHAA